MHDSFGVLYLGLDAQDPAYERESVGVQRRHHGLDKQSAFKQGTKVDRVALQALVDEAIGYAQDDGDTTGI